MRSTGTPGRAPARIVLLVAAVTPLISATACGDPLVVELPLLRTTSAVYELQTDVSGDLTARVDYTFTNRTGATVYIVNCNGYFDVRLERFDGSDWSPAWSALTPDCLSPPIRLEPGEAFVDTLDIWSGCPELELYPELDCDAPDGTYRIVWVDALSSFQPSLPFGPQIPLAYRTSNAFELARR